MVTKAKKDETLNELKDKFAKAEAVYLTEQSGVEVNDANALRKQLLAVESEIKVAKNTLMALATKGTEFEKLTEGLKGQSTLIFCYGDTTAPAGIVKKFSKEIDDKIKFKAGFLDGELLDSEQAAEIAGLPSKDVLLSQIAGMLTQPLSGIAYILQEMEARGYVSDEAKAKDEESGTSEPAPEASASTEEKKEEVKAEAAPEAPKAEAAPTEEKKEEEEK